MAKTNNPCPQIEFVRLLASKLDVTIEVADFIYKTYGVVGLELMQIYNSLKITPYIFLERKNSPSREFFNIHSGEYEQTEAKDRLYARVSYTNRDVEQAMRHIEVYEEMLAKQQMYEAQKEQERLTKEEQAKRERRNRQARTRRRKKNQRAKKKAMERLIHYEMIYHQEESRKYSKELAKRSK